MRFMTFALLLAIGLQVSAAAQFRILEDCDESSPVIAEAGKDASITIYHSLAGATTCYSMSAVLNGKTVYGYIMGRGMDALEVFESGRMKAERESFRVVLPMPVHVPVQSPASHSAPAPAASTTVPPKEASKPAKAAKKLQNIEI